MIKLTDYLENLFLEVEKSIRNFSLEITNIDGTSIDSTKKSIISKKDFKKTLNEELVYRDKESKALLDSAQIEINFTTFNAFNIIATTKIENNKVKIVSLVSLKQNNSDAKKVFEDLIKKQISGFKLKTVEDFIVLLDFLIDYEETKEEELDDTIKKEET